MVLVKDVRGYARSRHLAAKKRTKMTVASGHGGAVFYVVTKVNTRWISRKDQAVKLLTLQVRTLEHNHIVSLLSCTYFINF